MEMIKLEQFGGGYSITKDGKIFSHKSNKFLATQIKGPRKTKYEIVTLFVNGKNKHVFVHKLLAQTFIPNPLNLSQVDHINRNSTDNRIENLRWCTFTQNQQNRDRRKGSSKFKGVYWSEQNKGWIVEAYVNKKRHRIGEFQTEIEAAKAYNDFTQKHFGEFAVINEIPPALYKVKTL